MLCISDELTGSILSACFREHEPERSKWKGKGEGCVGCGVGVESGGGGRGRGGGVGGGGETHFHDLCRTGKTCGHEHNHVDNCSNCAVRKRPAKTSRADKGDRRRRPRRATP